MVIHAEEFWLKYYNLQASKTQVFKAHELDHASYLHIRPSTNVPLKLDGRV